MSCKNYQPDAVLEIRSKLVESVQAEIDEALILLASADDNSFTDKKESEQPPQETQSKDNKTSSLQQEVDELREITKMLFDQVTNITKELQQTKTKYTLLEEVIIRSGLHNISTDISELLSQQRERTHSPPLRTPIKLPDRDVDWQHSLRNSRPPNDKLPGYMI